MEKELTPDEKHTKYALGQEVIHKDKKVKVIGKADDGYIIQTVTQLTVDESDLSELPQS